ncbi:MAG: hypothetical protein ACREGJ_03070 [Candidatus Saccharimonadales bacterium]
MKNEFDLDQLHREVNALMDEEVKRKTKKSPKPASSKSDPAPASAAASQTPQKPPKEDDGAVKVTVKRPLPKLASHRGPRGAAMDIVQPKPASGVTPPSAKPKRTAPALQPTKAVTPEPPAPVASTPAEPTPAPTPQKPAANQDVSDDVLASINMQEDVAKHDEPPKRAHETWPDPLEVHGFKDEDEPAQPPATMKHELKVQPPTLSTQAEEEPKDAEVPAEAEKASEAKPEETPEPTPEAPPATTPFVKTKVEKRPLGAYTETAPPSAEPVAEEEDVQPEAPKKEDLPTPGPLPAEQKELSPEVVAVESNEPEFRPNVPSVPEVEEPEPAKPAEAESETNLQALSKMAIPPQYKASDKAPSKEERPVFDTKQYHPPIDPAHTAHRTGSKWGWILIAFLILLLLVAFGVAVWIITGGTDVTRLF